MLEKKYSFAKDYFLRDFLNIHYYEIRNANSVFNFFVG